MKKFLCILLAAIIFLPAVNVSAEEKVLDLSAPSWCLMEQSTGRVLLEENSHEKRSCASITKVMTLILTFEAIERGDLSLTDTLTASAHASSMGGSDIWLKEGETMTVDELIKATVVMSANDAAVVLAEAVSGSEEAFVIAMNEKAQLLGMGDTSFKNCNGLDEEGHLTSAHDVAIMSRELLNYELVFNYTNIWIDYVRGGETQLVNTNRLIKSYKGITGLKTGTTSQAGSCITATAERDGLHLIAVILGAPSTDERFADGAALLNYGFANYCIVTPEVELPERISVRDGMVGELSVTPMTPEGILVNIKDKSGVTAEVKFREDISAPIRQGDVLGTVLYKVKGSTELELPITAAEDIEEISFKSALDRILELLFAGK